MNFAPTTGIVIALLSAPLVADVVFDEAVSGDLSSDAANPTVIGTISDAVLLVNGSVQSGSAGDTRDYFTITVPDGATLEAMRLVTYVDGSTGNDANTGYAMIDEGTSSVVPSNSTTLSFLGGSRLSRFYFPDSTVNMLAGFAAGSQGAAASPCRSGPATTRSTCSRPAASRTSTASDSSSTASKLRAPSTWTETDRSTAATSGSSSASGEPPPVPSTSTATEAATARTSASCSGPGAAAEGSIPRSLLGEQPVDEEFHLPGLHLVGPTSESEMFVGGPGLFEGHEFDLLGTDRAFANGVEEFDLPVEVHPLVAT